MRRRPSVAAFLLALLALVVLVGGAPAARPAKKPRGSRATIFKVCRDGCRFRSVQRAVDAAGSYARRHRGSEVRVAIGPGVYEEGIVLDGNDRREDFDGMKIEGKGPTGRMILDGRHAPGARNGIEAIDVDGLTLKNLWARNFESSGFFVHASSAPGASCDDFTMDELIASGNRSYGLAAGGCLGGRIVSSVAYHQGEAGFSVGETPCDAPGWSVYDGTPCQAQPRWTMLRDDRSTENALGYSGPNSKYVAILESAFYDNGTGIVLDTIDGAGPEPNGWNLIERDDVFWNNYNPYLADARLPAAPEGFAELNGRELNYPTGVGIVLHGSDHSLVRGNHVFGNSKWGIASFSGPGETLVANEGNEAKNVDNEIVENFFGRGGADPNGEYDIWNDGTGGGNCWGANSSNSTFAPGNGKTPPAQIYPVCPQAPVPYGTARSTNFTAGLQTASPTEFGNQTTILGYVTTDPPQDQQCSWIRRASPHPAFQQFVSAEVEPRAGEVVCERR